jgi:hypothetical protein
MGARVTPASINLFVHAPQTRKSKNGSRASTALWPRAPGLRAAKKSLASPRQGTHSKRIPAHQTKSRRLNKPSATSGCSERIKLSGAGRFQPWFFGTSRLPAIIDRSETPSPFHRLARLSAEFACFFGAPE